MKVTLLSQLILLLLIVLVNSRPQSLPIKIAPIPATIALALLAMVHLYIKLKPTSLPSEIVPREVEDNKDRVEPIEKSFCIDECRSLTDIILKAKETAKDLDNLEQLGLELDTYRQCYMWIQKMEGTYGKQWRDTIQGAEMPVRNELYPKIHRLMMEISLHTIDFCRYRTGYVNLSPLMKINPTMMLLGKNARDAGASPISTDPYETDREARVLYSLLKFDGITLQDATIHGYYVLNEEKNENI